MLGVNTEGFHDAALEMARDYHNECEAEQRRRWDKEFSQKLNSCRRNNKDETNSLVIDTIYELLSRLGYVETARIFRGTLKTSERF